MWTPIQEPEQLPGRGTRENLCLDFKARLTAAPFECAKDVAAFANASGGTILVGARGGDHLHEWEPLTVEEAKTCWHSYEGAVRDRCAPAPLFDLVEIEVPGGRVVAVNVWPFPGQPVGVRLTKQEVTCCEGAFFFPIRIGTHTRALTPEQLPMLVDAKLRRIVVMLEQLTDTRVVLSSTKEPANEHWTAVLTAVNLQQNAAEFASDGFSVPLDFIESVYKTTAGWNLLIRGAIREVHWNSASPPELRGAKRFVPHA